MAGHILELRGCTPESLGNYLKGLGVFRLIAEQADPQARAWWKNGVLHVRSQFATHDQLVSWLKDDYPPATIEPLDLGLPLAHLLVVHVRGSYVSWCWRAVDPPARVTQEGASICRPYQAIPSPFQGDSSRHVATTTTMKALINLGELLDLSESGDRTWPG